VVPPVTNSVTEAGPQEIWKALQKSKDAVLVDVRTRPEWAYVGTVNLDSLDRKPILLEWLQYPDMSVNPTFATELLDRLNGSVPASIFFLCRSGYRSLAAAHNVAEVFGAQGFQTECVNILEGFEGDLDSDRHRGRVNGWKMRGLAWRQT
jgi:rhodanese-related sulfurtransferase